MCCHSQRTIEDIDSQIREIEHQIAVQRDLIDSLKSAGQDASRAIIGLAMLWVMLGQWTIARDKARLTAAAETRGEAS